MNKNGCYYRIEQLAHLALPSQVFIPAVLQELHFHISALSSTFCWIDAQGQLYNIFDEKLDIHVIDEFIASINQTASDNKAGTVSWISQIDEVITTYEMTGQNAHLADFYQKVVMPPGYDNTCFIPIQHNGGNIGLLMVHRLKDDAAFSPQEQQNLTVIATIIASGMTQQPRKSVMQMDGWEQGLLTVDEDGNLLNACDVGMKLLMLAHTDQIDKRIRAYPTVGSVFKNLPELIKSLFATYGNRSEFPNPVLTTSNAWGDFSIHGFLIADHTDNNSKQIGLTISKQEPFILKLFHRIKRLNLTSRQETVGLLYATGQQHHDIAETLGLSLFTVKEHVHNLSVTLKIHSRSELIELILCDIKPEILATAIAEKA